MAQHRQAPSHFKEEPGTDSVSSFLWSVRRARPQCNDNMVSPFHESETIRLDLGVRQSREAGRKVALSHDTQMPTAKWHEPTAIMGRLRQRGNFLLRPLFQTDLCLKSWAPEGVF